ncbi:MAG: hypothetical protein WD184_02975 [Acidimicrobiia bacterium]
MASTPELHRCDDCGLHYEDKGLAAACYTHCTTHHACSIEITAQSVERRSRANPDLPLR